MKKTKSALSQTKEYLKFWKKALRLNDWKISSVSIEKDPVEFPYFGAVKKSSNFQLLRIRILDPQYIPEDWEGIRDLEVTIVHELLHTRLTYCSIPKSQNIHEEMAVETLAILLVSLRRGVGVEDIK